MTNLAVPSEFSAYMPTFSHCGAVLIGLTICAGAGAADRSAYKYVDENGKVVYSEYPPPTGTTSKRVDMTPSSSGRPSSRPSTGYDNPNHPSSAGQDKSLEKKAGQKKKTEEPKPK
jgi:hypothetical protein